MYSHLFRGRLFLYIAGRISHRKGGHCYLVLMLWLLGISLRRFYWYILGHSTSTSVKQCRELLSLCSLKHFQFRSWFSPLLYVSDFPEHSPFAAKSTILVLCLKNVFFKCLMLKQHSSCCFWELKTENSAHFTRTSKVGKIITFCFFIPLYHQVVYWVAWWRSFAAAFGISVNLGLLNRVL